MEAREETTYWVIPPVVYQELMDTSLPVMKYTNDLMAERFSDVMWTMEQILGKSVDKRLAALLSRGSQNTGEEEFPSPTTGRRESWGRRGKSSQGCCGISSRRGLCFFQRKGPDPGPGPPLCAGGGEPR